MVAALVNHLQQHHIMNMTKCVATHKNMADSPEQENVEEGATTLGSDVRTVRQLTGEATASGSDARTVRQLTGEVATSGNDARTVRQPTGETAGAQSIWNITGTVTESVIEGLQKRFLNSLMHRQVLSGSPYFLLLFVFAPLM